MSESQDRQGAEQRPEPGAEHSAVIRPVSYRPATAATRRRVPLTPLQGVLLVALLLVAGGLWFLFTAKSVRVEFVPAVSDAAVTGGASLRLGDIWLLRTGPYRLRAEAPGYHPLDTELEVTGARNQTHRFELVKLPGRVRFASEPEQAEVTLDEQSLGTTPTGPVELPAGPVTVTFRKPRYQPLTITAEIAGMDSEQTVTGELLPDWAEVTVTSRPAGAAILVDDAETGVTTPGVVQLLSGERELQLRAPGHRAHRQRVHVEALETRTLPEVELQRADAILRVRSTPPGAGITLNGQYQGETPLEIAAQSGETYRLQAFRAGHAPVSRELRLAAGTERSLDLELQRLTGTLVVQSQPEGAELFLNGRSRGSANQTLTLPTDTHRVEIRMPGHAGYEGEIELREGITQELKVRLLTLEEARLAALVPEIRSPAGQALVLLKPDAFTMGASRRQPGRRGNETQREVILTRLFYLGRHEVTNAEFRRFERGHDSGRFQDHDLNADALPAVNLGWDAAARYCNWLSDQEGLPRFYRTEHGAVVGFDANATGYRLPTEAEWEWAARQVAAGTEPDEELRFPWGNNLPPPDRHGNYADRSAANLVGRVIFDYDDNHIVAAPPGSFPANEAGLFDLSGNVAEWVSDYYEIPDPEPSTNPLGPPSGEYHVIRGSSWMHGTITELRLAFRDYGTDGRQDVGFRVARFAEAQ